MVVVLSDPPNILLTNPVGSTLGSEGVGSGDGVGSGGGLLSAVVVVELELPPNSGTNGAFLELSEPESESESLNPCLFLNFS